MNIHFIPGIHQPEHLPLLLVLNLLMLAPIFYGFKIWVKMLGAEEGSLGQIGAGLKRQDPFTVATRIRIR